MGAGPWASLPERIVTDRLQQLMSQNAETISAVRPRIPNIGKVAPRFCGRVRREPTIDDVALVGERYPGPNADPLSQRPGFMGSPLPGFGLS